MSIESDFLRQGRTESIYGAASTRLSSKDQFGEIPYQRGVGSIVSSEVSVDLKPTSDVEVTAHIDELLESIVKLDLEQ